MTSNPNIKRGNLAQYGFLALPLAFAGMPLYVHAPDFYATEFGVSLSTIGFILLGLRFFDAIQDPLIGKLSDHYAANRHLIIVIAAFMLVIGFAALFRPFTEQSTLLWFALSMLLATSAFSVLSINLNTLGGLWSKDTHQKTRIAGVREAFGLIGLLLAVLLPATLKHYLSAPSAFFWITLILAGLMCVGILVFSRWYKNHPEENPQKTERTPSLYQTFRYMPKELRLFFTTYVVSMLASSIPAILVLFFIRDRMEAESYTGLFLLIYFLSGAVGMVVWQKLSRIHDKTRAWLVATLLAVASFIWAYFLQAGDIWQYGVICLVSGLAFGADLALPPSILADYIHRQQAESQATLQFSLLAFLAKTALAVASAIVLPLLDQTSFQPGATNSKESLWMLSLTYAAIPCAIKLVAAALLWRMIHATSHGDHHETPSFYSDNRSHPHA